MKTTINHPRRLAMTVKRTFPNIPSNADILQTIRNTRGLVSRLPAPHACRRGLSHLNPSQRTKELYIYKTLLLPSTTEVKRVVNAVWNAMAACRAPHFLSTPSLTDPRLALVGESMRR